MFKLESAAAMRCPSIAGVLCVSVTITALTVCGADQGRSTPSAKKHDTVKPVVFPTQHRGSLQLSIRPTKNVYRSSESIDIEVVLRNIGSDPLMLFPVLSSESEEARGFSRAYPSNVLRFAIVDSHGKKQSMISLPEEYQPRLSEPGVCELLLLVPNSFIGRTVSLTSGKFAYRFGSPGRYTVKATLQSRDREWLRKSAASNELRKLPVGLQSVINGVVSSDEIVIEVR